MSNPEESVHEDENNENPSESKEYNLPSVSPQEIDMYLQILQTYEKKAAEYLMANPHEHEHHETVEDCIEDIPGQGDLLRFAQLLTISCMKSKTFHKRISMWKHMLVAVNRTSSLTNAFTYGAIIGLLAGRPEFLPSEVHEDEESSLPS